MAKDKGKEKAKGSDKKKDTAKAKGGKAQFTFNPSLLNKTLAQLKSIMGDSETIDIRFKNREVHAFIATPKGRILLIDSSAIESGEGELGFQVARTIWTSATDRRAKLTLERGEGGKSSFLLMKGNNYNVDLHFSEPQVNFDAEIEIKLDKGVSANPIIEFLSNCQSHLGLTNLVEGNKLNLMMRWGDGKIEAAQVSNTHGMLFRGALKEKKPGNMTLPVDVLTKLVELGGEIGFKGKSLAVASDKGLAEFSQLDNEGNPINLDTAFSLLSRKYFASFIVDGPELDALMNNALNVTEWGKYLTITFQQGKDSKGKLGIKTEGRYGNVEGQIDIADVDGKLPPQITIFPNALAELSSLFTESLKISISEKVIKIEHANDHDWQIAGCSFLSSLE